MGTNYYVRTTPCPNACEHCAESQAIHLGKASAGWRFLFQAQPDWPREQALIEWLKLATSGPIQDEYGHTVTIGQLLAVIHNRREQRTHADDPVVRTAEPSSCFENDTHDFCARDFT